MFHIAYFAWTAIPAMRATVTTATTRERSTLSAVAHKAMTAKQYNADCTTTISGVLRPNIQRKNGYPIGRNAK